MNQKIIYLTTTLILVSCVSSPISENQASTIDTPDVGMAISENGDSIYLYTPDGWNSFKIGESVYLMVQNTSGEQFIAEYDLSTRLYLLQNNDWVEINNKVVYPDTNEVILEPSETLDPLKIFTLFLLPDIPNTKESVTLRIFVEGRILGDSQDNDQQVATYIDLQLHP